MSSFASSAATLSKALEAMPKTISGEFTHTHNVNLNGAEIVAGLGPQITKQINDRIEARLGRVFKEHMPDAGVSID